MTQKYSSFWLYQLDSWYIVYVEKLFNIYLQFVLFAAYSQVITLTVYTYLFSNLFGHQYLEPKDSMKLDMFNEIGVSISKDKPFDVHTPVVHIPLFTLIEFIAYLGWIKVAETLLNPWGDDDEDFQINYLIDRNFQVGLYAYHIWS